MIKKDSFVIVRARDAGVHAGYYQSHSGREVKLTKAIRLWKWWSSFTLSNLAIEGVLKRKESEVRFSKPVSELVILDACEIIECSVKARKSIEGVSPWINK